MVRTRMSGASESRWAAIETKMRSIGCGCSSTVSALTCFGASGGSSEGKEGEIDALLRPGMTLDLSPDRRGWHIEQRAADLHRKPPRSACRIGPPGRPQQIGN